MYNFWNSDYLMMNDSGTDNRLLSLPWSRILAIVVDSWGLEKATLATGSVRVVFLAFK